MRPSLAMLYAHRLPLGRPLLGRLVDGTSTDNDGLTFLFRKLDSGRVSCGADRIDECLRVGNNDHLGSGRGTNDLSSQRHQQARMPANDVSVISNPSYVAAKWNLVRRLNWGV